MKKKTALLLALCLALSLAACGGGESASTELRVFAAASLQETLTEIGAQYERDHPGVALVFNFDSSGALKTQIQEGADCDLFISAGQKQMDQLDAAAGPEVNTEKLDFVDSATRINLLENQVVLAVPEGNPKGVESFDDLAERLAAGDILLAMGNSDVPVGQYTQKILQYYGLEEAELAAAGVLTYGSNVKEVATQVAEAAVDCGVIYATDAFSAGLTVADTAAAEMCGQVIYPAAVMKNSAFPRQAADLLAYLAAEEGGMPVFQSVGFSPAER